MKDGRERSYVGEEILQALGREPNIKGLHLDLAEVTVDGGRIMVDGAMRTSQAHIYAVGDVNDVTPIVHLAIQQGEIAAYNATHADQPGKTIDHRLDMEVVFTDSQVAGWDSMKRARRPKGFSISRPRIPLPIMGRLSVSAPHTAS